VGIRHNAHSTETHISSHEYDVQDAVCGYVIRIRKSGIAHEGTSNLSRTASRMEDYTVISGDPFKRLYDEACVRTSDINEHLPKLYELAMKCSRVTEFGVRDGSGSTLAFLYAVSRWNGPTLRSYDIDIHPQATQLFELAKTEHIDAQYIKGNTLDIEIEPCDLLFIDSLHTYEQLKAELDRHAGKVSKYLVFHDTKNMGLGAWDTEPRGLLNAILDYMIEHPGEWNPHYNTITCNGLLVLKRSFWSLDKPA
jgi:hypothetical protein